MKKALLFSLGLLSALCYSQKFEVKLGKTGSAVTFDADEGKSVQAFDKEIPEVFLNCGDCTDAKQSFRVFIGTSECNTFKGTDKDVQLVCDRVTDFRDKTIQIRDDKNKKTFFTFVLAKGTQSGGTPDDANGGQESLTSVNDKIKELYPNIVATTYGLQIPSGNTNTKYAGKKYVHIFIDQFGNNLYSTMPQGVSNRQYVVHTFYIEKIGSENDISYSVNQLTGEFEDVLVFNNSGELGKMNLLSGDKKKSQFRWAHQEFLLRTSTTDVTFEVIRTSVKDKTNGDVENKTLKTYTIKMSKVYHGSFDVGLIKTTLENPTYELVASPDDATQSVVKKTEAGDRGVITAMATFYTSPVILLESLFTDMEIPPYKLTGRNFLDDHKIYERIYPSVGVGFTEKTLENLFYGLNWEFARGGAIFAGWHYGKVNTFKAPDDFTFGETPMSQAAFDLRKGSEWNTSFAIGVKLDIMIVRNLFKVP